MILARKWSSQSSLALGLRWSLLRQIGVPHRPMMLPSRPWKLVRCSSCSGVDVHRPGKPTQLGDASAPPMKLRRACDSCRGARRAAPVSRACSGTPTSPAAGSPGASPSRTCQRRRLLLALTAAELLPPSSVAIVAPPATARSEPPHPARHATLAKRGQLMEPVSSAL